MDREALLTPAEMARADALAGAAGVPVETLMAAAGRAVAQAVRARFRPVRTLVLAGPGNNGGDGWVAARLLDRAGWPVAVAPLAWPAPGTAAAEAAARFQGPVLPFAAAEAARAGLVIDAVFGAGLARSLSPEVAAVLAAAGQVVAVDVPSGLCGATGQALGAVRAAALTVTFFRRKPGHLLLPGRAFCGEVLLADIGLPAAVLPAVGARLWRNTPALWRLPRPEAGSHKYSRGHVTILAGAAMPGAARLAAAAARRAGAGLVAIEAPDATTATLLRGAEPGVLVTDAASADPRHRVWVVGPGLPPTPATLARAVALAVRGCQVVGDAGLFGAAAGQPAALAGLAVLTPHAGEFARVFGDPGPDKVAAVRAAAAATGATVLLKGADTVIAAADGRAVINDNAPPSLATAGAGDVLAGLIAGLLAQGMPAFEAAAGAAWLHGAAAPRGPGVIAEDVLAGIAAAWAAAAG